MEEHVGKLDDKRLISAAFVILCAKVMLDLSNEEALEILTEGGGDFGIDAMSIGDITDGDFTVTIIQAKYSQSNLEGNQNFPQGGVEKCVQAVRTLFSPTAPQNFNKRLQAQVEEIRSLIVDGVIPNVRVLLCNNGLSWKRPECQQIIDREGFNERVTFEHINHDVLVKVLQSTSAVADTLQFNGKAFVEDFNYSRVFIGKMAISEIGRLMRTHGDRLLERNIRRYLGLHGNRINEGIKTTLMDPQERQNFYFYNNGITLICDRFDFNALQSDNYKVRVEGLQIINGGQTSKTVFAVLEDLNKETKAGQDNIDAAFVLVRLYQVPKAAVSFVKMITYATNSQNPVDLKDLRSNQDLQKSLEMSIHELGFDYRRQRTEGAFRANEISVGTAAEAILCVWRGRPQQAKFRSGDHFGKLYDEIFTKDLNGAQLVMAVLIFRIAESKRRRPPEGSPELVRYGSCFSSMLMGRYLLEGMCIKLSDLDHRKFAEARKILSEQGETYFDKSVKVLGDALNKLYGGQAIGLQRLSATFRRGDLLQYLT